MHRIFIAAFILLSFASTALAADKPAEISSYVKADKPYGTGKVTFAFMSIYDAALWTDAKPFSWEKPFALRLVYHHHLTTEGLVKKTLELMEGIDHVPEDKLKTYGEQLSHMWPDVHDGDTITAIYQPQGKTLFFYNGKAAGTIDDPAFGRPFFDVWLSPETTEPETRKGLLALK